MLGQAPVATTDGVRIDRSASDDPALVAAVERALHGEVRARRPARVSVVRIDGWFSRRWLRFVGKVLGAVRVTSPLLIVPPFVPGRVIGETHLRWDEGSGSYTTDAAARPFHVRQRSAENRHRSLASRAEARGTSCVALWLGVSPRDGRAAAMLYAVGPPAGDSWYVSLVSDESRWDVDFADPMSTSEARRLLGLAGE